MQRIFVGFHSSHPRDARIERAEATEVIVFQAHHGSRLLKPEFNSLEKNENKIITLCGDRES